MQKLKQLVKRSFPRFIYRKELSKKARIGLTSHIDRFEGQQLDQVWKAGYDVFTYHGEDGIINYLLQFLPNVSPVFVDIGSGDGVKSNCATLAVHFGWEGLFIDKDPSQLAVGKSFYKQMIRQGVGIKMLEEEVTPSNINNILDREGVRGEIGLLSIDVDGNDYWIWKAIEIIEPAIVVIEAKVEFGERDIIVPYGKNNHHSVDKMYNGASVEAFRKLGSMKGYKLAGSNRYGYNLFFVRMDTVIRQTSTVNILGSPEVKDSFYPASFFVSRNFVSEQ